MVTATVSGKGLTTLNKRNQTAELPPPSSQPTQVSAKPNNPTVEDEKVRAENESTKSNDKFLNWFNKLRKARKEQDRGAIEECFDAKYNDDVLPQTPYEWEVWKHTLPRKRGRDKKETFGCLKIESDVRRRGSERIAAGRMC